MARLRIKIFLLFFVFYSLGTFSQMNSRWTHYSSDDGLTENTVLSMFQDNQGFMWFGTFSGLNRFDGYKFKTYKAFPGNQNGLQNDRIEYIEQDKYGFIWIRNSDGRIYRLDKNSDVFESIPQSFEDYRNFEDKIKYICKTASGSVWLISSSAGCFEVKTDATDFSMKCQHYSVANRLLPSDTVTNIYEDSEKRTWILTKCGFSLVSSNNSSSFFYNKKPNSLSFNNIAGNSSEILLVASKGKLLKFNKKNKKFSIVQLSTTSTLRDIIPMQDKNYLILTESDGFFIYKIKNNTFDHFNAKDCPYLKNTKKINAYVDRYNEVWITSEFDGIVHFNPKTRKFRKLSLTTDKVGSYVIRTRPQIFEDIHNNLWIYPRIGGFSFYNRNTGQLEYFHNSPNDPQRWFSNVVNSSYSDNQGNLWLSTFSQGIEKIIFYPSVFNLFKPIPTANGVTDNEVRAISEDKSGNLWVAMRSGFIMLFDKERRFKGYLGKSGSIGESNRFNEFVYSILVDKKNNIWLGTKGKGLFKLQPKSNNGSFDIKNFTNNSSDKYSLSSDVVYALHQDKNGRIWIGTFDGGLNYIDEKDGKTRFINGYNDLKKYPIKANSRVRCIQSSKNTLWVGTTNGVLSCDITFATPQKTSFTSYKRDINDSQSLSANDVCNILVTKKAQLFFGTIGGGLNILQNTNGHVCFKSYNTSNNFPADVILGLVEDRDGIIWISSENKIVKFDLKTTQSEVFSKNYGIEKTNFSESAALVQNNGNVLFGCSKGLYHFNPSQIHHKTYTPQLVFTSFILFNKEVHASQNDSPLSEDINLTKSITLNNSQSVFTIEFSALDYSSPDNILYAYKLESGDKTEYIIQKQRSVTFTKLQPGEYVFKVKSTNSEGVWVNNEREIHITVLPPFWRSGWAYTIYALLFIGIVILAFYILFVILKLRNKVTIEQAIDNHRVQFFTDISHELRTPLTLISLPVERILTEKNLPPSLSNQLQLVKRNIDRMVRLVNQILEFRKIQELGIKLFVEETPLSHLVSEICEYFSDIAKQRSLAIELKDETNAATVFIDKDKVEKIIYNILSNAIKYSPNNSTIRIKIYKEDNRIFISIQDEGAGLSPQIKENLFKLYATTGNDNEFQTGMGIGLAFSKKIANAHKATLDITSEPNQGACVKIGFLLGMEHFDKDSLLNQVDISELTQLTQSITLDSPISNPDTTILVVEDNIELRQYMVQFLKKEYKVIEAEDGEVAIEKVEKELPDIIISDVMMPKKDGLELTQILKTNPQTSHIPIILLTAKTTIEDKLSGIELGADDYITKPFNAQYLDARIQNIIKQRKRLQDFYRSSMSKWKVVPTNPEFISPDKQFMDKLMSYMENHFSDSKLSQTDLESYLCLSTSSLYRKIKSLTDLSPNEFVREFRLIKAAHIIKSTDIAISEIAEMTGFNDYRYFTRCFKLRFNMTALQYRAQNQE